MKRAAWLALVLAACGDDGGAGPDATACAIADDDPTCCGAGGVDCLGGACTAGVCGPVLLADGVGTPADLAVAGGFVYFTSRRGGTVERVATDGTGRTVVADDPTGIQAVAATPDAVAWTTLGDDPRDGHVMHLPIGGTPAPLATAEHMPCDLALDDAGAAWANAGSGLGPDYVAGELQRWTPAGGVTTALPMLPRACAVAMTADTIAVTARGVSALSPTDSLVALVPRGGGAATIVAENRADPGAIALTDTHVYWVEAGDPSVGQRDGALYRAVRPGGAPERLAGDTFPAGLAVVGDDVYWIARGALRRLSLADRRTTTLLELADRDLVGLVTDGTALYFMTTPAGTGATGLLYKRTRH